MNELVLALLCAVVAFPLVWWLALRAHARVGGAARAVLDRDRTLGDEIARRREQADAQARQLREQAEADAARLRASAMHEAAQLQATARAERERLEAETRARVQALVDGGLRELEAKSQEARARLRGELVDEVLKVTADALRQQVGPQAATEFLARLKTELR
ncbi:hypothetical protein LZ017_03970 [Pelomonas sp. CA6]|uniref:hypothetical protein n=1 Tax=Pelomonas sp. CA6 TaxID=2907999 RepID=UPI001F4B5F47|nr:hypothetical protein [Pelomonas sp. CA6]MCH7342535.1 hypothetical protein [Pelomonas sp. CA6]